MWLVTFPQLLGIFLSTIIIFWKTPTRSTAKCALPKNGKHQKKSNENKIRVFGNRQGLTHARINLSTILCNKWLFCTSDFLASSVRFSAENSSGRFPSDNSVVCYAHSLIKVRRFRLNFDERLNKKKTCRVNQLMVISLCFSVTSKNVRYVRMCKENRVIFTGNSKIFQMYMCVIGIFLQFEFKLVHIKFNLFYVKSDIFQIIINQN